jgi:hypothetical protein
MRSRSFEGAVVERVGVRDQTRGMHSGGNSAKADQGPLPTGLWVPGAIAPLLRSLWQYAPLPTGLWVPAGAIALVLYRWLSSLLADFATSGGNAGKAVLNLSSALQVTQGFFFETAIRALDVGRK